MSIKRMIAVASVLSLSLGGVAFAAGNEASGPNDSATMGQNQGNSATMDQNQQNMDQNAQSSSSNIKQAQQALKDEGLYHGPVDGKWGSETQQAVAQFQKQKGLKQTAQLDDQTLDQLQHAGTDNKGGVANENNSTDQNGTAGQNKNTESGNQAR